MTERSEGAADAVGVAAKRPTERSEGAADAVGVVAKRPTERSEGAADAVGVVAKRTNLIAELKRRNVFRMAGLYLVGAWLIVQVVGTVLPMFGAPAWIARGVVVLLAIGFAPALVFSWMFELTPQGLKRDGDVELGQSIAPQTARRLDRLLIAVLLLALTYFGFDRLVLAPRREDALVASTTRTVEAKAMARAEPAIDRHSIAVLPFVNMSGDAANEYFSDGISEEILNVLAGAPELRVAARTSSFSFKGKAMDVPAIARALKVRMVLEGSVRKQGDQVRITAQLIDAQNGFHVWSQTYNRKLEDIFAIQDEIARAISDALKVRIAGAITPSRTSGGTPNLEAYDRFLRGMALWHTRRVWDSIGLFEQAIAIDPTYARSYAGLALAYAIVGDYSTRVPQAEGLRRARNFAEWALALDPSLPEPYAALGQLASGERQRPLAEALFRRSIALRPSFATAHQWRGALLVRSGDLAGALASLERASELDPRSQVVSENHALVLRMLGRNADAKARCLRALAFASDDGACLRDLGIIELEYGDLAAARITFERNAGDNPGAVAQGRELVEALAGQRDRHALALRYAAFAYNSRFDPASGNALEDYDIPSVLMLLGEPGLALGFLEGHAVAPGIFYAEWAVMMPALDPIRCEPRFRAIVKRLETTDPHFARVCAGKP